MADFYGDRLVTLTRWGTPALAPGAEAKVRRLIANPSPQNRNAIAQILNKQSRILKQLCEDLAEQEVNRRPIDRRSPESRAHGREYHDSFEIITAKEQGYAQYRAGVRNTHPGARAVENGTPPHDIPLSRSPIWFPWDRQKGAGGIGRKGPFPVAWGDAPTFNASQVSHPGAQPHRVMRRSRDKFRKQAKRILNR